MKFFKEFKEFVTKGNAIDMAVGIVIGAAFGKIVDSLVKDIIMPPIAMLAGKVDFSNIFITLADGNPAGPYRTLASAKEAGALTVNIGLFANDIISFIIIAFAIFVVIRAINRLRSPNISAPIVKDCPYCLNSIPMQATRCGHCTSEITATPAQ